MTVVLADPDRLPATGSGPTAALLAAGIALTALGVTMSLVARRRATSD